MPETVWNIRFDEGGLHFRYRFIDKGLSRAVVFFPGLRARGRTDIEHYNRLTWAELVNASCLFVADPGLTSEVRGTWFQGNSKVYSVEAVSRHVTTILQRFGIDQRDCTLYGSSQGGFAAMASGAFMPSARIVAEAPQTDVARFGGVDDVNSAARACYGVSTMAEVPKQFNVRLRLADLYKARGYTPRSTVLIKRSDLHHVDAHLHPLLEEIGDRRISVEMFDDLGEAGHTPLPKEIVIDRLNSL